MPYSEELMQRLPFCGAIFTRPPRRFHSPYKFNPITWSGLEHSMYLLVRRLICWRQRHGRRRHTKFLEPSFQPGGSEQNEHPALLRFDCERVGHVAR